MNLKLVVASMSILGLVTCPVFAATDAKQKYTKHHKMMKHRVVHHDYKEVDAMPVSQPCPQPICTITQETMIMQGMTQNVNRSIPNPCYPDWFKRVQLAGGINVDAGKWGNRNANFMGENYQRLSLNDAYLNLQATVNDWVHAFASISYNTATINDPLQSTPTTHVAEFDAAYSNNVVSGSQNALQLEQAFATFANFDCSPIFFQIGKQFQDFGRYEIHPITESITQVMSKTLATSAKLGFIASGFSGAVFVFDDPLPKTGQASRPTNYGISLGYDYPSDQLGFDLGVAYLYNLIGVNDVAYAVNQFNLNNGLGTGYNTRAAGLAAYVDVNSGPFVINARYVTALQRFNVFDLPKNGLADLAAGVPVVAAQGARPWSAGVQAAYGFDFSGYAQNIYVGYQASNEAAGLMVPKNRWLIGYGADILKNTSVAVEWDHDNAYSVGNGGSGNNTNLVTLRAAVKFG